MNRLANALLFAVVVMAAFVLELRSSHPQYSPANLLTRVMESTRPAPPPVYVGSIPQAPDLPDFDDAAVQKVVERAQRAQVLLTKVKMRQIERQTRIESRIATAKCKIVRMDQ